MAVYWSPVLASARDVTQRQAGLTPEVHKTVPLASSKQLQLVIEQPQPTVAPGISATSPRVSSHSGSFVARPPQASRRSVAHEVLPISARERKQVYMHSTLFKAEGAPAAFNVYNPVRQQAVISEMKKSAAELPARPEAHMPCPADYKATVNSGHWVVTPWSAVSNAAAGHAEAAMRPASEGYSGFAGCRRTLAEARAAAAAEKADAAAASSGVMEEGPPASAGLVNGHSNGTIMRFDKDADPVHVVHAHPDDGAIPKEFWANNTQLHWTDPRSELQVHRRGKEFHELRRNMSAKSRKRQEMSSEILGTARNMEESTAAPTRELRSCHTKAWNWTDSALDRQGPSGDRAEDSGAMTARERMFKNQSASNLNALRASSSTSQLPSAMDSARSPRRTEITTRQVESVDVERRRRLERNYSDLLFGQPVSARYQPSPSRDKKEISKGEPTGCTTGSFLHSSSEVLARRLERAKSPRGSDDASPATTMMSPRRSPQAEHDHTAWAWQDPKSPRCDTKSPQERRLIHEERSCFDTVSLMDSAAEVSRRHRERRHPDGPPQPKSLPASKMKRVELTSSRIRVGTGHVPAEWDDGRTAPPPFEPKPGLVSRSLGGKSPREWTNQHIGERGSFYARSRKVESLMSNHVF
eukprot:TRINITY_DN2630_c4_g1_i1.p1 TRINITY_DN2630_c4_g1~~TRINITY_DN2630_c4_g1_i1.p1  ORF type:complete len:641 (-),score=144.35 TRINITY_DN2630_c4_g1_i1:104-2026(-)